MIVYEKNDKTDFVEFLFTYIRTEMYGFICVRLSKSRQKYNKISTQSDKKHLMRVQHETKPNKRINEREQRT